MNMKKIIISWMLTLALVSLVPGRVSANGTKQNVVITIDNQSAVKGQQVTVSVQMNTAEPLAAFNFFLYYDTQCLKLMSSAKGDIYPKSATPTIVEREDLGRVAVGWMYTGLTEKEDELVKGNGSCLELTFEALQDLDDVALIRLKKITCSNFSLQRYQPYLYYGDVLLGDVNQDGEAGTLKDAYLAFQIYRGKSVTNQQLIAADIFGKAEITKETAFRFLHYTNGKEQYLY